MTAPAPPVSIAAAPGRCTRSGCLQHARAVTQMRNALGPALPLGGDPVDALSTVVAKANHVLKQRNAYAAALRRVQNLWTDSQRKAGIVLADELGAALYIGEDEIR